MLDGRYDSHCRTMPTASSTSRATRSVSPVVRAWTSGPPNSSKVTDSPVAISTIRGDTTLMVVPSTCTARSLAAAMRLDEPSEVPVMTVATGMSRRRLSQAMASWPTSQMASLPMYSGRRPPRFSPKYTSGCPARTACRYTRVHPAQVDDRRGGALHGHVVGLDRHRSAVHHPEAADPAVAGRARPVVGVPRHRERPDLVETSPRRAAGRSSRERSECPGRAGTGRVRLLPCRHGSVAAAPRGRRSARPSSAVDPLRLSLLRRSDLCGSDPRGASTVCRSAGWRCLRLIVPAGHGATRLGQAEHP